MAGGAPTYWEKSCPKCGKPSNDNSRDALNKVNPNESNKKVRCVVCGTLLYQRDIEGR